MKSNRSITNTRTGSHVTKVEPGTLIRITDLSKQPEKAVNSGKYGAIQPIYLPKGPTDTWINFDGEDVLAKFTKLFGKPNTNLYGQMATYAKRLIEGGFRTHVLNVAPPDATHANTVCYFTARQKTDESDDPVQLTIYGWKNGDNGNHFFAKTREELVENYQAIAEEIKEVSIPYIQLGFESKFVSDVGPDYDPEEFLGNEDIRMDIDTSKSVTELDVSVPVFGLFYEGRGDYGNNYTLNVKDTGTLINNEYPYFNFTLKDKDTPEFTCNATLFNVLYENISTSFRDNMNKVCNVDFSARNSVKLFRPFLIKRKVANKLKTLVPQVLTMVAKEFEVAIKTVFTTFDVSDMGNYGLLVQTTLAYTELFKTADTEEGRTLETPFSHLTPWTVVNDANMLIDHTSIPEVLQFEGGFSGLLSMKLQDEEFSWDIKQAGHTVGEFEQMFLDVFTGKTDPAIFDMAIVGDGIILPCDYPPAIQSQIRELCRYKEEVTFSSETRPDFTFLTTNTLANMEGGFSSGALNASDQRWVEVMNNEPGGGINHNVKPFVGKGIFNDPTTGGQNEFDLFYDWFGEGSALNSYLQSGVSDPFASGSWSTVESVVTGTETGIPDKLERRALSKACINYFVKKRDGSLALGEDTALMTGWDSLLKDDFSSMHFNRIMNEVSLVARDNPIIDPTPDNLKRIIANMMKKIKTPAKYFGSSLQINPKISTNPNNVVDNVVVYEVSVAKGKFSRHNIVDMTIKPITSK